LWKIAAASSTNIKTSSKGKKMLITHLNFAANLKQSANPRGGAVDGNIHFNQTTGEVEFITVDQLATVDFGAGPVANPLTAADGITMRALYNFENQERAVDNTLAGFKRFTSGDYRFAGAYSFVNGNKPAAADRGKIRNSGWIEYDAAVDGETTVNRIYHGVKSLNPIQATTTPYWTLVTATDETTLQAAAWADFGRPGPVDEAVQVFGAAGHGDFDYTARVLAVRVRSWGYNAGETTSVLTGIAEFSGFSAGYGIGESLNSNNSYALADVYGGAAVAPWTGMTLEMLAVPQTETGFNEADGDFTWVLHNAAVGTVQQCAAYLDAVMLQDADIDVGTGVYNGKKGRVWYSRDTTGRVVTSRGLFIEGLSTAEKQNAVMTADDNSAKTSPFFPEIRLNAGAVAVSDPAAWYRLIYVDGAGGADYDTATAVTVNNAAGTPIYGNVAADVVGTIIFNDYDYDGNTQAGLAAGVDKNVVALVEGNGIAAQAIAYFTITRTPIITVTCAPGTDTNA
jgi:hypothetical protein